MVLRMVVVLGVLALRMVVVVGVGVESGARVDVLLTRYGMVVGRVGEPSEVGVGQDVVRVGTRVDETAA